MFFIDDVMLSPFKGLMFIAKEVAKAADQAREADRNNVMRALAGLHQQLEAGAISDDEFDEREAELLDKLEEEQ